MVKATAGSPGTPKKPQGLKSYLKLFREYTKRPENFLTTQNHVAEEVKSLVKALYDHGTKNQFSSRKDSSKGVYLEELVTDQMDGEQIFQQLELKNEYLVEQDLKKTSTILSKSEKGMLLSFSIRSHSDEESAGEMDVVEEHGTTNGHGSGKEEDNVPRNKKVKGKKKRAEQKPKTKRSMVDDRFFKLDDMAKFLDEEDERERRRQNGMAEKNPLIEIDYFDEHTGERDDSEEEDLKYGDFFEEDDDEESGDGESGNEDNDDYLQNSDCAEESEKDAEEESKLENNSEADELDDEEEMERNRKLRFEIYKGQGGLPVDEYVKEARPAKKPAIEQPESSDSERDDGGDEPKSSFELRQEKLHQKITRMEEKMLKTKPWQLKGEITADTRPQNSLLEEVLQFESTTRPVPVISEETTMKLEDIIRQRIKNKAFDDVERKVRPPDNPREYRKQLVLDGEKSKASLAQVYEQEYLQQLEKSNPDATDQQEEEPKEHVEIRRMMKTVLAQLDALSNFHYTPRPAVPEVKILTNTAAISMEEVAPVAASDANLLAPEEVHHRPKGDVMSKAERTKTDQNRERRLKKRFQQQKFRREAEREQKQLAKANAGISSGAKQDRQLQTSLLKKVTKAKNVQQMAETSSGLSKSSTAFFAQLQDEVQSQVKAKANGALKKKKPIVENLQASSMKL
ncbi:U3 small nucleolar ribonucleoprotein protein MPP10 [Anopheles bellator]|uniref:U3 small nucleolar ribonucleoprotein protein MPP10 n=1 Tax=Anopheles bellator TaxID=139047 RepID=UPI002648D6EB|nr:U3 small nucleolar ribonucleoprotein protein MPP10 [Anopheles bellator]